MKALTIRQPWAWAIAHAGKNVENRDWFTHYRGPLAIHAGLGRDDIGELPRGVRRPSDEELTAGAIIAMADLVEVVEAIRSKWFEGTYGWVLANVRPLKKPVACKGSLGLWTPSSSVVRRVRAQL
jgi:hypothetical protein